jgi:hypothetical protein
LASVSASFIAAELEPPLRDRDRPRGVDQDRRRGHRREAPVVERPKDGADQHDLEQRRHDLEQQVVQQVVDAVDAALDRPRHPAGLAVEVEAQREPVEVLEGAERDHVDGVLRDAREHDLAQLGERRGEHARGAVGGEQAERHDDRRVRRRQRVDRLLVDQRHVDGRELGRDHQRDGRRHPQPQRRRAVAPQIGQQAAQHREIGPRGGLGDAGVAGGHGGSARLPARGNVA